MLGHEQSTIVGKQKQLATVACCCKKGAWIWITRRLVRQGNHATIAPISPRLCALDSIHWLHCLAPIQIAAKINNLYHFVTFNFISAWSWLCGGCDQSLAETLLWLGNDIQESLSNKLDFFILVSFNEIYKIFSHCPASLFLCAAPGDACTGVIVVN